MLTVPSGVLCSRPVTPWCQRDPRGHQWTPGRDPARRGSELRAGNHVPRQELRVGVSPPELEYRLAAAVDEQEPLLEWQRVLHSPGPATIAIAPSIWRNHDYQSPRPDDRSRAAAQAS